MRASVDFGGRSLDWSLAPVPGTVTSLDQVHGNSVVVVDRPGAATGAQADAAVTTVEGATLLIRTADCAPVALVGYDRGGEVLGIGAAHAGWRGLLDGVLPAAVAVLRSLGATHIDARLGPCIGPECYEFGDADLASIVRVMGSRVAVGHGRGGWSLDLVEAARISLQTVGVGLDTSEWSCTACSPDRWFSYRARRESGRQGMLVRLEP